MNACVSRAVGILTCLAATVTAPGALRAAETDDTALMRARKFVESSERYLHHSKLRAGMKGYGLTVLSGTEIQRFDVEIVSVMAKWGPHQDVIIARLSGLDLERTGVISGMSGSPVFVRHEGADRMIGAVAFGWFAQLDALCGLQPITQMLAMPGMLDSPADTAEPDDDSGAFSGWPHQLIKAAPSRGEAVARRAPKSFLRLALHPGKPHYTRFAFTETAADRNGGNGGARLRRLRTPLMISGISEAGLARAEKLFAPAGVVPLQSGSAGEAQRQAARDVRLEPGSSVAISLATGDLDLTAVGTVTDVLDGGRVLALGHAFFAAGDIELPMGTAWVHTVIPGLITSFKLGSPLEVTGAAGRDETVGLAGQIGGEATMIPLSVSLAWEPSGRRQEYNYQIARHRFFTSYIAGLLMMESLLGWHELPEENTLRYDIAIDYGELGTWKTSNLTSGMWIYPVVSDVTRPLGVMLNNPYAEPPPIRGVKVNVTVSEGQRTASLESLRLDGEVYRPGDTITGALTLDPYRADRRDVPIEFELPEDLPEGVHTLTVCDAETAAMLLMSEKPQEFDPRSVGQLLGDMQRLAAFRMDRLYMRLPLQRGGLALGRRELPDLPPSKAQMLREAQLPDTYSYTESLVRSRRMDSMLTGSVSAQFQVRRRPSETLLREQRESQ